MAKLKPVVTANEPGNGIAASAAPLGGPVVRLLKPCAFGQQGEERADLSSDWVQILVERGDAERVMADVAAAPSVAPTEAA